MKYETVAPMSRENALEVFEKGDETAICDALVRITFHDVDKEWVQVQLIRFSTHSSSEIRGLIATCFGHLARIHGSLGEDAMTTLEELKKQSNISERVDDALDDIEMYTKNRGTEVGGGF